MHDLVEELQKLQGLRSYLERMVAEAIVANQRDAKHVVQDRLERMDAAIAKTR